MSLLQWEDRFSVGMDRFDRQHHVLVDLINELHESMREGKGQQELGSILEKLIQYTRVHFASEEEWMVQYQYPGYARHQASHESLTRQVLEFQRQYQDGTIGLSVQMIHFLKEWLVNHILGEDKAYAGFFQAGRSK
ncbi:hemerythrin-like metal-binding domain [Anaerolinea thermolimosa]|uniref:bacteriohemerythrin n=1 Tax=Anaerolinea thermolimosa TaxID=229919 RepID=UPI00078260AE|nr:bacteriohemerythrin [Anaerolinea thermolimosa]GAP05918.1 hemerythrin-like metal-binding domain [Anaerolinea thermolimosa]